MIENLTAFQFAIVLSLTLLSVGSLAIFFLKKINPQNLTFKKVAVIIRSWWLIVGTFLLALNWFKWGIILLMFFISIVAIREYLLQSKIEYKKYLLISLSVLCGLQYLAISFGNTHVFMAMIPVFCLWLIPGLVIFRATIKDLPLVAAVGFGLSLMIYYLSHIAALSAFSQLNFSQDLATMSVLVLVLITWSNDIFQFLAGKSLGKTKIVPEVSPNKTLAGFIGGFLGTLLLTGICANQLLNLKMQDSIYLGLMIGFTGMFGDLFFSAVKRHIGVKDFSQAIPGHGGLLDRLDSLIFTAPIYFHYLFFIARS